MISVLIPTYNFNIVPLVNTLRTQFLEAKISYEIIVADDASRSQFNTVNETINQFDSCSFQSLKTNLGRSKMRNFLAQKANYKWLLFLDGDVMPSSSSFTENLINYIALDDKKLIFCGGVKYKRDKENKPFLRYKYGIVKEEISAELRTKNPNKYFFSSNFLISKSVFEVVQFEEFLTKYGKEDFLFALSLKENGFNIQHVANEVYHLGIDNDLTFINKTKKAMENLVLLEKKGLLESSEANLLKVVKILENIRLTKFTAKFVLYLEQKTLEKKSLFFLNCLKISYLCKLKVAKNS